MIRLFFYRIFSLWANHSQMAIRIISCSISLVEKLKYGTLVFMAALDRYERTKNETTLSSLYFIRSPLICTSADHLTGILIESHTIGILCARRSSKRRQNKMPDETIDENRTHFACEKTDKCETENELWINFILTVLLCANLASGIRHSHVRPSDDNLIFARFNTSFVKILSARNRRRMKRRVSIWFSIIIEIECVYSCFVFPLMQRVRTNAFSSNCCRRLLHFFFSFSPRCSSVKSKSNYVNSRRDRRTEIKMLCWKLFKMQSILGHRTVDAFHGFFSYFFDIASTHTIEIAELRERNNRQRCFLHFNVFNFSVEKFSDTKKKRYKWWKKRQPIYFIFLFLVLLLT